MSTITKKKINNTSNLYDYLLWCNTEESTGPIWYAIPKDEQISFFNGNRNKVKGVISCKNINTLITQIKKL